MLKSKKIFVKNNIKASYNKNVLIQFYENDFFSAAELVIKKLSMLLATVLSKVRESPHPMRKLIFTF
jgi:hypothetical protein